MPSLGKLFLTGSSSDVSSVRKSGIDLAQFNPGTLDLEPGSAKVAAHRLKTALILSARHSPNKSLISARSSICSKIPSLGI